MKTRRIRLIAAVPAMLSALAGAAWAQAPDAARNASLFGKLGCAACHGAPGAGGHGGTADLAGSAVAQMRDGGQALYLFMGDAAKGHPDLNGRPAAGIPAIAPVSQAEAAQLVLEVQAGSDKLRGQKGRAEAPAVIAASGVPCTLTDAAYAAISADRKTRTQVEAYELACAGALGRVVVKTTVAGRSAYEVRDCISTSAPAADGKANALACILPGNQDLPAQLAPYIETAGAICTPGRVRALGSTAGAIYVEAACDGERGYVIGLPPTLDPAGSVTARNCLAIPPGAPTECRLATRAAMLAGMTTPLVARSGGACQVKDSRYVATSRGDEYYEVSCLSGPGFMVVADFRGGFKSRIDCANAENIAGGCALTDVTATQTADNARYAGLARAAGYDCAVSGYRAVAATAAEQTVEVTCANRTDGGMIVLAPDRPARVFNCAAAETTGYRCGLTKPEAAYARLTAALKAARPASTCQVSASRFMGVTPDAGFVEVACADKDPGYVLQYSKATAIATEALYCSPLNARLGVTCALPSNIGR